MIIAKAGTVGAVGDGVKAVCDCVTGTRRAGHPTPERYDTMGAVPVVDSPPGTTGAVAQWQRHAV